MPDLHEINRVPGRHLLPPQGRGDNAVIAPFRVADLLIRARKLLDDPDHWCQDVFRQDESFCLAGALIAEASVDGDEYLWPTYHSELGDMLQDALVYAGLWVLSVVIANNMGASSFSPRSIQGWNDHPDRRHEEVLEALDMAIRFELSDPYARTVFTRADEGKFDSLLEGYDVYYDDQPPDNPVMATFLRVSLLIHSDRHDKGKTDTMTT